MELPRSNSIATQEVGIAYHFLNMWNITSPVWFREKLTITDLLFYICKNVLQSNPNLYIFHIIMYIKALKNTLQLAFKSFCMVYH